MSELRFQKIELFRHTDIGIQIAVVDPLYFDRKFLLPSLNLAPAKARHTSNHGIFLYMFILLVFIIIHLIFIVNYVIL